MNSKYHNLAPKSKVLTQCNFKQQKTVQSSFGKYLLQDYTFLQDYEMIESKVNSQMQFIAKIKNSQQFVKFKKTEFKKDKQTHQRFESLVSLFNKGVILADNIFLLEQNEKYFYYVIEAYLSDQQSRFMTLRRYLRKNCKLLSFQNKKSIFQKLKVLFDCLYQHNHAYCGLSTKKIIIDSENDPNLYLMPFQLQINITNNLYARSYYPPQILLLLENQQKQDSLNIKQGSDIKDIYTWDIWSLGCITLEIFFYLTPYFLCTSISKQFQKIKKNTRQFVSNFDNFLHEQEKQILSNPSMIDDFSNISCHNDCSISLILQQKDKIQQNLNRLRIFLINSLKYESTMRSISFQQNQNQLQELSLIKNTDEKRTIIKQNNNQIKPLKKIKKSVLQIQQLNPWKQLNVFIYKQSLKDQGNYELSIKILTISNINFKKQLKISLVLRKDSIFNFHVDSQQQTKIYNLNRKLTLTKKQFKYFQEILSKPIYIQISEQSKKSKLQINLQTLIMIDEGKRIWKNALIGTYQVKSGCFEGCKVKLNCKINKLDEEDQQIQITNQQIEPQTNKMEAQQNHLREINQQFKNRQILVQKTEHLKSVIDNFTFKDKQNKRKEISKQEKTKNSSNVISKINSQLSQLSNYWKSKNGIQTKILQKIQKSIY